jgi:hypothetical protein
MKALLQSLARPVLGLLLVSGVATAAVATNAQPAQAGVVVSVGFGVGYAPAYHRYYRHYRHYGPRFFAAPVVYGPPPAYVYSGPIGFGRPYYYAHYRPGYGYGYGHAYGYGYGRGYGGHRFYR